MTSKELSVLDVLVQKRKLEQESKTLTLESLEEFYVYIILETNFQTREKRIVNVSLQEQDVKRAFDIIKKRESYTYTIQRATNKTLETLGLDNNQKLFILKKLREYIENYSKSEQYTFSRFLARYVIDLGLIGWFNIIILLTIYVFIYKTNLISIQNYKTFMTVSFVVQIFISLAVLSIYSVSFLLYEVLCFWLFGSTLGKFIFSIYSCKADGSRISFRDSLARSWKVLKKTLLLVFFFPLNLLISKTVRNALLYLLQSSHDKELNIYTIQHGLDFFRITFALFTPLVMLVLFVPNSILEKVFQNAVK